MAKQCTWTNSQKTLFLPKNKGGIILKESEAHNLAMRIKPLLALKQKERQPPWMHIAIYWLGKDIYNYNKEFHHLKSNNIIKSNNMAAFIAVT